MIGKILKRIREEFKYASMKDWNPEDTGRFWDSVFDYEDINDRTYSYSRRFADSFNLASPLADGCNFLDICCRSGNGSIFYWKKGKVKKAVCADLSEFMLDICRKNLANYQIEFETKIFNSYNLSFPDNEFEIILSLETIEHLSKPFLFIKELARIAKNDGTIIISTPNVLWEGIHSLAAILGIHHSEGPHRFIRRKDLCKYIKDSGLEAVAEDTFVLIPGGPKALIGLGEYLERIMGKYLRRIFCLRRIFICRKKK